MSLRVIVFSLLLAVSLTWPSSIQEDAQKAIEEVLAVKTGDISFSKYQIPPPIKKKIEQKAGQKFFRPEVYLWSIEKEGKAYKALLDNVLGKALPITFMVIFDPENKIVHSQIIRYREPIGGAVENLNWNKQFVGMNKDSKFKVGDTIDGISGATISVRQVSKGIYKLCELVASMP